MRPNKIPDTDLWEPPKGLYCGPTALCAITGLDYYASIRPAINRVRGRASNRGVVGMKNSEMVRVLAQLGWRASPIRSGCPTEGTDRLFTKPRLPEMLRVNRGWGSIKAGDIILVETTRHYVVIHNNTVVDNHAIESLIRHPARRQLARRAWQIVPVPHARVTEVRRAA